MTAPRSEVCYSTGPGQGHYQRHRKAGEEPCEASRQEAAAARRAARGDRDRERSRRERMATRELIRRHRREYAAIWWVIEEDGEEAV